ncbi:MAG: 2-oxoglutarate oxidoreductase [Synergistaceae bacterium]|jgi:2-oxoglutarate ferredoxin oxidoreductase subunit beta|nr:2-oxoglutarate oxidoreductase [Synergistaceae bacterium]
MEKDMEKVYSRTKGIRDDMVSGLCPGCMHGTAMKLIGELLEEMDLFHRAVGVLGIGCGGLHMEYMAFDNITAPHGRACAVATGIKRSNPESLVFTYQGDGDLAAIGLGESLSAANRGENISVIFINNGIYGMTGGQMAPTTLLGMKASTAPKGRAAEEHGYPMHMCEIMNQLTAPAYLERTSCNTPRNVLKTKNAIRKAFQNQLDGKGFSMVEIVTSCPTNWGMDALTALDYIEEKMLPEFPLGVTRDRASGGR